MSNPFQFDVKEPLRKSRPCTHYSTRNMPKDLLRRMHIIKGRTQRTLEEVVVKCIELGLPLVERQIEIEEEVVEL